jgi:uracil-DNA glycosylase family 4
VIDREKCKGCPLEEYDPVDDILYGDEPRYMIVTEAPARYLATRKRLLSNGAGKVLSEILDSLGYDKKDFVFVPQIRCVFDPETLHNKVKAQIQKQCRAHLVDAISHYRPDVILPLGTDASKQVIGRAVKITKVRGIPVHSEEHDAVVLPLLHPGYVAMYPQHHGAFAADCETFARLTDAGLDIEAAARPADSGYTFIDDLQFLVDAKPEVLVFDTETTGLSYFHKGTHNVRDYNPAIHGKEFDPSAAILTMQFCIEPGTAYMLCWDHPERPMSMRKKHKVREQLVELLCNPDTTVIGQNAKFDSNFVFECLGIRYPIGGDTLMLAALIDENAISKSQNAMVKQYVPSHAGYDDCIHPASRVLLENLTTKLAADIQVGDRLVGFEEMSGVNRSRQLTECVVEAVRHLRMVSVRIVMDSGESIQVSTNHQFLLGPKNERNGGSWKWRTAASLRVGDKLKLFPFPDEDTSYSAGWLSGILDGEGYACNASSTGLRVGFCQLDGPVLQKGISLFNGGENCVSWDKRKNLAHVTVSGARAMRELIRLRPVRLVNKKPWIGKALFTGPGTDSRIRSIEYVGVQEVVSIQTSSRTFITEGFASHNCFNATYDKGRMWEVPLDAMLQYGCGDVDTCLMLYDVFMDIVSRDSKLLAHYTYVSLPGINSFADIEVHGTHIDLDALRAFERLMEEAVEEEYMGLLAQVPKSIKRKHIDKGLKFSRGDFVRDILFDHPDGFRLTPTVFTASTTKLPEHLRVPSISSKDHLPYFYDNCPFTLELAEYVKDERILGTSVRGFQNKYIHDGVVRPTYSLWTTVTGRTASENPNGQNYIKRGPRAKAYRKVFVPPPGCVVVEADYSQAELRIVADMANEPAMLEVYRSGGDIHVTTALIVLGITLDQFHLLPKDEQKLARQKAKAVNFGFVYGMGWRKFIGYAKTQYGVEFTEREAQRIREAYFLLYSMLQPWHEAMRQFASQHLMVRSYSGRIRHLPMMRSEDEGVQQEAGRQAINSPVQGFASDLGLIAVSRLQADIEPRYLQPIAFVHDALYCYAPEKYALWAAETLKHYMETNPLEEMFGRRMRVPILADVTIGRSFGDTYELPGFTLAKDFDPSVLWDAANETGLLLPKQYAPPRYGARVTPQYGDFRAMLRAA